MIHDVHGKLEMQGPYFVRYQRYFGLVTLCTVPVHCTYIYIQLIHTPIHTKNQETPICVLVSVKNNNTLGGSTTFIG